MQNNQNILTHFQSLSPQSIANLSPQDMKQMLLTLHSGTASSHPVQINGKDGKRKGIRKIFDKQMLKTHLKDKFMGRLRRRQRGKEEEESGQNVVSVQQSHSDKEGKLKFNLGANLQINSKINNFTLNIPQVLSRTNPDQLSCPICLQLLMYPVLTTCGHTFCYQCIDQGLLFNHSCPSCRQNIRGCELTKCAMLQNIVKRTIQMNKSIDEGLQSRFKQREESSIAWRRSRMLDYDNSKAGDIVDVRDTQTIWCQGTIVEVHQQFDQAKNRNVTTSILIHYNRWHSIYNQVIEVPSARFAPLHHFSSRSDILHYNLSQDQDNVRGSVSTGFTRIQPRNVHFIRIDQSNQEVSSQFFSDIEEIQEEQDLRRLNASEEDDDEEGRVEVEDGREQQQQIDLGEYVNQMRRSVLSRLAPDITSFYERRQRQSHLWSDIDQDEESYMPEPVRQQQQSVEQWNQPSLPMNESPQNYPEQYQSAQPQPQPELSYQPYNEMQMLQLLKDNSDQNHEMFGPQDPSNMLQDYE